MNPLWATSYVALVAYSCDWAASLKAEHQFLWSHSLLELSPAQLLYILTRYSTFLCLAAHIGLLRLSEKPDRDEHICRHWLYFSTATVAWIYGLLFSILMLRVYALFRLDGRIILALLVMVCFKAANLVLHWFIFLPITKFSTKCIPLIEHPTGMVIFTVIELVVQGVPVYLTLSRCAKIKHATHEESVISLVVNLRRQGTLCWTGITAFSVIVIAIMMHSGDKPTLFPHVSYPLFITAISATSCRLILQMRKPLTQNTGDGQHNMRSGISFALDSCDAPWDPSPSEPAGAHSILQGASQ